MAENEAAEQETENSPTQLPDVQSEQTQVEPVVVSLDMAKRSDFGIADMIKAQLEQQGMAVPAEQILKSRQKNQAFQMQPLRLDTPLGRGFSAGLKLPDSNPLSFDIKRQDTAAMLLKQN